MPGKYNPEKPASKVKFLETSSRPSATKFRAIFELDGVEFASATPVRNFPAKTNYHQLKPSAQIQKHPAKKVRKSSRVRKILDNILTKPQPTPVTPHRFKKEARNSISYNDICAGIRAAQEAEHRAEQEKLRNILHVALEEQITRKAREQGISDCESAC